MKKTNVLLALASILSGAFLIENEKKKRKIQKLDGKNQTVLITGATSGIGRELAEIFAMYHFNLVAVSRNENNLKALKEQLEGKYGIEVYLLAKDLSAPNAAKEIYDQIQKAGIVISQLVNNAGAGKAGSLIDTDSQTLLDLMELNVVSFTMLAHYFGKEMAKRKYGRILNVSSVVAFSPNPYFNVYGPGKAYDLCLSEAMYGELKELGVSVSVLCPGPTRTNWAETAGKAESFNSGSAKKVAQEAFIGMQEGKLIIVPYLSNKLYRYLLPLLPVQMQAQLTALWQKKLIKKENRNHWQ